MGAGPYNQAMDAAELYGRDFYEWAVRNAELLRSGRVHEADLSHIAIWKMSWPRRTCPKAPRSPYGVKNARIRNTAICPRVFKSLMQ